ncbi:MAG: lysophospholipid acyltransferase family protein, partial [Kiritimatiellae bacterium]|nr:lysophospholipid acyltransferase family protein [Kiritimatiellia bacterium]
IAVDNILAAGIARGRRDAARMARRSFQSLAQTVAESVTAPPLLSRHPGRVKIALDAPPETLAALHDPARGVILVSAHLGNWELAAKVCSAHKRVTGIARRMDNPLVQRLMERRGVRDGMDTIDKHDAHPMKIVRVLKRHEMLALLVDQHASGDGAVTIDFMGRPARSYTTPAVLQRLTGAPILVGAAIRNGPLDFSLHFSEPIDYALGRGATDADILRATQDIASRLAALIRRWPDQYLWAHRRWKQPALMPSMFQRARS